MLGEAAPCALPSGDFVGLPRLLATPPGADFRWRGPALGDDRLGLGRGDRLAVGVADDIGGAAAHDSPGPLGQAGGEDAQRAEVVFAALGHLLVEGAGKLGVLACGRCRRRGPEWCAARIRLWTDLAIAAFAFGGVDGESGADGAQQSDLSGNLGGQAGEVDGGVAAVEL